MNNVPQNKKLKDTAEKQRISCACILGWLNDRAMHSKRRYCQGCRGYEISHPYPHTYPQIFSWISMGISMDISMDIPMDYL